MTHEDIFLLNLTRDALEDRTPDLTAFAELDIPSLLQTAFRHRLFCLLHSKVLPAAKNGAFYPQFQTLWMMESQNRALLRSEIKAIAQAFLQHQIPYIIIKGILQEQLLYGQKPLRDTGDIDLIVLPEDRKRAYQVLKTLDYLQPDNPDGELRNTISRHYWETSLYKNAARSVTLELKTGSSALRKNFKMMFNHTQQIDLDGFKVCTLNDRATLVHLFANAHEANEARGSCKATVLREYFETLLLLRRIGFSEEVVEIAEKMEARHKIYEVLRSLDDLYGLTESEKQAAMQFHPDQCRYPFELDGWSNKSEDMNCGLLFNPFKPHTLARIFDQDYAFYLYGQMMKNAVFNKPVYHHRHHVLQPGGSPLVFPYEGREDILITASWNKDFQFGIIMDQNALPEWKETRVELKWYERDMTRPNFKTSLVFSVEDALPQGTGLAKIACQNYFKTPAYQQAVKKINEEYQKIQVPVYFMEEPGQVKLVARIPLELLPIDQILPTLVCEIDINIQGYSYGDDTNAFSFNLYGC